MRRALSAVLIAALFAVAFGFAGCGKKGPPQPPVEERLFLPVR